MLSPLPPAHRIRPSGSRRAIEWYPRLTEDEDNESAVSPPPLHAPAPDAAYGSQISGRRRGLVLAKLSTVEVPPVTSACPVGSMVRFMLTRPNAMSPEACQSESLVRSMYLLVLTAVAPTSV